MNNQSINLFLRYASSLFIILLPLSMALVFALHFRSLDDFFKFKINYEPKPAELVVTSLITRTPKPPIWHNPHMIAYLASPLFILVGLTFGKLLWKPLPWVALIGGIFVCAGAIFMGGLFATWSTLYDIRYVSPGELQGAIATWKAMTSTSSVLAVTTSLSKLTLIGVIVFAFGFLVSRVVPFWSPILIIVGCSIILIFMDLDNWMFLGATCWVIGVLPISRIILQSQ